MEKRRGEEEEGGVFLKRTKQRKIRARN